MHEGLHEWDRRILKKSQKRLRKLQRDLEWVMRGPMSDENEENKKHITAEIEMVLNQEEIYYKQRARVTWLKKGDRNTRFFQNFASNWKKRNYIKRLKDGQGNWMEGTSVLNSHIRDYFLKLFSSQVEATDAALLEKIFPKVNDRSIEEGETNLSASLAQSCRRRRVIGFN